MHWMHPERELQFFFGHHKQITPLGRFNNLWTLKYTFIDLLTLPNRTAIDPTRPIAYPACSIVLWTPGHLQNLQVHTVRHTTQVCAWGAFVFQCTHVCLVFQWTFSVHTVLAFLVVLKNYNNGDSPTIEFSKHILHMENVNVFFLISFFAFLGDNEWLCTLVVQLMRAHMAR